MSDAAAAQILAKRLVEVANGAGMPATALLTDMNQPLALAAGNTLEVREAIECLKDGKSAPRLREVVFGLSAQIHLVSGHASSQADAQAKLETGLTSGRAAEVFAKMVSGLGGPAELLEGPDQYLPKAPVVLEVKYSEGGFVTHMDTRDLGLAVVALGGGRCRVEDPIDHSVGIIFQAAVGDKIEPGHSLAVVHAAEASSAEAAAKTIANRIHLGPTQPQSSPVILEMIS